MVTCVWITVDSLWYWNETGAAFAWCQLYFFQENNNKQDQNINCWDYVPLCLTRGNVYFQVDLICSYNTSAQS